MQESTSLGLAKGSEEMIYLESCEERMICFQ